MKPSARQQPCQVCVQRSVAQLKSAARQYRNITESHQKECDEGFLGMLHFAKIIEAVLNDSSTVGNELALLCNFWDTPNDINGVSDAYILLVNALTDAVTNPHN
jgi:hypothetical protein